MNQHYGAQWVREVIKVEPSPLGIKVADLIYYLLDGMHHARWASIRKVEWTNPRHMEMSVDLNHMATVDFDGLTRLVFLAHALCVRVELHSSGPHMVKLFFSERKRGTHRITSHPTLDEAVAKFHDDFDFLEAEERTQKWLQETTADITCSCCHSPYDFQDTGWRWNGAAWEHKCPENDPQAGYFVAEKVVA